MPRYYYLDTSMNKNFDEIFRRAQQWAASALKRLDDPNDSEFREVFQNIFKTSVMDNQPMPRSPGFVPTQEGELHPLPVLSHVRRALHSFAHNWTRTDVREIAEVRIHRNALQQYVQIQPGLFYDPVNGMVPVDSNWVEYFRWACINCNAFVIRTRQLDHQRHQNSRRNVIYFTEKPQINWLRWAGARLHDHHVDSVMNGLLEHILIHEMMHCEAYGLLDFYNERGQTSSWDLVARLHKGQAYICAESIATLCLAAAVADLQPVSFDKTFKHTVTRGGFIVLYRQGQSGLQSR